MSTVYVRPAAGCRIRQPERASRVMPDSGDFVPRNSYYERLIISGDVTIGEVPSKPMPNDTSVPKPTPKPTRAGGASTGE